MATSRKGNEHVESESDADKGQWAGGVGGRK